MVVVVCVCSTDIILGRILTTEWNLCQKQVATASKPSGVYTPEVVIEARKAMRAEAITALSLLDTLALRLDGDKLLIDRVHIIAQLVHLLLNAVEAVNNCMHHILPAQTLCVATCWGCMVVICIRWGVHPCSAWLCRPCAFHVHTLSAWFLLTQL